MGWRRVTELIIPGSDNNIPDQQGLKKDKISHIMHSTLTANTLVEENKVSDKKRIYNKKITKLQRIKRKQALERFVKKIYPKKRRYTTVSISKIKSGMLSDSSIRTHHEEVFESYLKMLELPYLINQIFCFNCSNYYNYGDQISIPKKCQVCRSYFHTTSGSEKVDQKENESDFPMRISCMSRPDFVLDYNTDELRDLYRTHTRHHKIENIKEYQEEYMSKVSIVRIDGSIHQKQSQMVKDYHQYMNYSCRGVKVFIVQNELIDDMISIKDNGKSLLKMCHDIGEATINPILYEKYHKSKDFQALIKKPF